LKERHKSRATRGCVTAFSKPLKKQTRLRAHLAGRISKVVGPRKKDEGELVRHAHRIGVGTGLARTSRPPLFPGTCKTRDPREKKNVTRDAWVGWEVSGGKTGPKCWNGVPHGGQPQTLYEHPTQVANRNKTSFFKIGGGGGLEKISK